VQLDSSPESMATGDLVKELTADAALLIKRQIELAKLEAKAELKQSLSVGKLLGAAAGIAYAGLVVLLVAGALALSQVLGRGLALGPLIVGAALLLPAAILGLTGYRRLKALTPLPRSRAELTKEIAWSKTLKTT
jgi:hypothetical protein